MKALILSALMALSFFCYSQKQSCLQIDIVLVGDLSGSVSGNETQVGEAFAAFVDRFELSNNGIRIGIVTFGNFAEIRSNLSSDKQKLKQICSNIPGAYGSTNLTNALEVAGNMLIEDTGIVNRQDVPKLIILVTDGEADDGTSAASLSEQLQRILNVGICGIMIENESSKESYLKSIVSPFCNQTVTGYVTLIEAMKSMDICL